MFIVWS